MFVMNLRTGETREYDNNTMTTYAVLDSYMQERSEAEYKDFLDHVMSNEVEAFAAGKPLEYGRRTVACGDWCALKYGWRYAARQGELG